ncbi:2-methylaconitate cis-trans isomerase PrpF [Thalassotalea litorea]|uniref:2-methylaconitate cis-trans isomerase PrpF n=1 Tax=Thalassotalea litorea TaxID=2020715 RepID=UPI003736EC99
MHLPQIKIPATYMRGGTSKGVFFNLKDLPAAAQQPGAVRDAILLRVIGSPDPYQKHTDGMGGATSSTSKTVILSPSDKVDHDVDYLFGQVAIDKPFVDWSGNCGNLTAAVGAFAIEQGMLDAERIPENGVVEVRIWQVNIGKTIIAHVPVSNYQVQETGDFELDGVTFPAAEVVIDFLDPADKDGSLFPTNNVSDTFAVPDIGRFDATFINAGIPTIFIPANQLGFTGAELQEDINNNDALLARLETIRAWGAMKMGLISSIDEAKGRQHTPKLAFVSPASTYIASSGKTISDTSVDILVRAMSMGKLHHAMMGTAAVAIGAAAAIPGTVVAQTLAKESAKSVVFGHPSGTLKVGAKTSLDDNQWQVTSVSMSRSARVLMEGQVRIPGQVLDTCID